MKNKFLGIDIGGTNIKIGLVDTSGNLLYKKKYLTAKRNNQEFHKYFIKILEKELNQHNDVKKIGIGVPGMMNKKRETLKEVPNIQDLEGVNLKRELIAKFPSKKFYIENDANAAALGEYYFAKEKIEENYIFITLGTGIGGAVILEKNIFLGGNGNAMEIGHILSKNKKTLEENIGKKAIMSKVSELKAKNKTPDSVIWKIPKLDPKKILLAAVDGDKLAKEIFKQVGVYLGEALVSAIRLFDIRTVIIGGGLGAAGLSIIKRPIKKTLSKHLTEYYLKKLAIKQATLANEAGIIGAASLCFIDSEK